ncbi:reverse transcriptase domain-containing protein [Tanacetum coccineum]
MTPIYEYLTEEILPEEKRKARAIHRKADRYDVTNETLYKRSFLGPWLRCVRPLQELDKGMQLLPGPFLEGPGKVKFLMVAIDYFTKWIKAKPVATITEAQVKKFVWDNIVCRFGLPGEIIFDNGKQFRDNPFKDWCEKLCIRQCFASVKHPNGETPFSLTYGTEAVIPVEIGMPTMRTAEVDMIKNDEALEINLDVLEEKREYAAIQEANSKAMMEKYYNTRIRRTSFRLGDLVCWNNEASRAKDGGKLGPKWEGPYEVTEALDKGAYKLRDRNGNTLPRTWNVCNLKKCYVHEI